MATSSFDKQFKITSNKAAKKLAAMFNAPSKIVLNPVDEETEKKNKAKALAVLDRIFKKK